MEISPTTIGRFIIAMGAGVGWLMTGSVTQDSRDARNTQSPVSRPASADVPPPARFTEVLRERMRAPASPDRGRNPFSYGSRHVAPARESAASAEERAPVAALPVEPPPPVFKLSGIATSHQEGGAVLTAIVIDNGVMVFAHTGDKLSNGYAVLRVDDTSITLVDAAGVTQTIRLP